MQNFWVKTDSIPWAVSLAGSVSKTPKEFRIALVSDNPLVQWIGQSIGGTTPTGTEIILPQTEEEFHWLDEAQARRMQREMEEIHGLVLDQGLQIFPLQYVQLVSTLLIHKYGLYAHHGFFCPDPLTYCRKQTMPYAQYNVLIQKEEYRPNAEAFADGYQMEPNILCIGDLPIMDQVYALGALNRPEKSAVFLESSNPLNYVAKAWYTDMLCLTQRPAILSVLPPDPENMDRRSALYWAQQIPVMIGEELDVYRKRGYAWRVRWECKFDNHEYYRRVASGLYGV